MFTKLYVESALLLDSLKRDQRGVTAIEYALVAVAISGIVAAVFGGTSGGNQGLQAALEAAFDMVAENLNDTSP
ncbi:Flp family type IVb pilin [Endozoicomonas sp.]|uniref:Flp family type IVb pilin n=1 Tax=Endozoicomonas sp. TaxID=1892382 RepID=UPI0028866AA9|nr:Flp family type IVb pilin [Endozoicomonas sp.]